MIVRLAVCMTILLTGALGHGAAAASADAVPPSMYASPLLGISFFYPSTLHMVKTPQKDRRGHAAAVTFLSGEGDQLSDEVLHFSLVPGNHSFTDEWIEQDFAPTGYQDIAPRTVSFGRNRVLYYGEGGGGVYYPDQFFIRRGTSFLVFEFYGPVEGNATGKGPGSKTRALEQTVLSSLRLLQ